MYVVHATLICLDMFSFDSFYSINVTHIIILSLILILAIGTNVILVDRNAPRDGRVLVCINGTLARVCDDSNYWGEVEAQVVCRQLGYQSGE